MGEAREKDQADFDLERFIDMFDEALTSRDPRVVNALRSLMMMTILTKSETYNKPTADRNHGPLRRLYEDVHHINRRLYDVEENIRAANRPAVKEVLWKDEAVTASDYWNNVKLSKINKGE